MSPRTMNYSAISHILVGIAICLLCLVELSEARPWWSTDAAGYDASLDPVAWSRSFVQDHVRKTRYDVIPSATSHRRKNRHRLSTSKLWEQKPRDLYARFYKRFSKRRHKLAAREKFPRWIRSP